MPIVILVDVSLSMSRPLVVQESGRTLTRYNLAVAGVNTILDHLTANSKLEFVALIVFSSLYEGYFEILMSVDLSSFITFHYQTNKCNYKKSVKVQLAVEYYLTVKTSNGNIVLCGFTRDYEAIRSKLRQLEDFDKTCLDTALHCAYSTVLADWGHQTHAHIILVTDGCAGTMVGTPVLPPPPTFPCSLHILCISSPNEASLTASTSVYKKMIDSAGSSGGAPPGTLHLPDHPLSPTSVTAMFKKLCNEQLSAWRGTLTCGALEAKITLAPAPIPHTHTTDFDSIKLTMNSNLEICGFISIQDIGSPMALSRHLILPTSPPPVAAVAPKPPTPGVKGESPDIPIIPEEDVTDAGRSPNFCVLLHGSLKVENMAGLVELGEHWYGLVHSWADSKKKSNLMLSVLPPGDDAVPWLGPLGQLGPVDPVDPGEVFPVRAAERRSYAGAGTVWVKSAGLQADLHKLLRHARKLPDKTHHFYKEVNRIRRAALALGWSEALGAAANILDREAKLLPPAATAPLTIAAIHLRDTSDPKFQLPLSLP